MSLDKVFLYSAIIGGSLFLVQLILMFLGGGVDLDVDMDADAGGDGAHDAADASFKVLSLQGLTAFFMMFGLVGIAMRDEGMSSLMSLGGGIIAGVGSTWLIGKMFQYFSKLQSSGTLKMDAAAGAIGQVYLSIGPDKPGKVTVTVGTRSLTLEGIVETDEILPTGTPIEVVRVISDTAVVVKKQSALS